jgi:hypothetical protein
LEERIYRADGFAHPLQNGGVVEHAVSMFEVTPKTEAIENDRSVKV